MKDHSKMADNAKNEFRQFAWNLASSISKTSAAKSNAPRTTRPTRASTTKRLSAK